LHQKVTREKGPYTANRLLSLLSKMFTLAIRWEMRTDNPAKGVERNPEEPRCRFLSGDELQRLTEALAAHPDQQAANVLRLLLLTGARRGEVLEARWDQFNLATGVWTKPSSHTKQKREHRVPLSTPVRQLLAEIKRGNASPYLFPGQDGAGPRGGIYPSWAELRETAQLDGVRIHDLRHTFASVLASEGSSLPLIAALLGHSRVATTHRYAHLFDDPLRAATERAGAIITGNEDDKPSAEVLPIRSGSR
jgi:integrase